jgi:hypothetical protein
MAAEGVMQTAFPHLRSPVEGTCSAKVRWREVARSGYGRRVSARPRQQVSVADLVATRQRRLLVLDGFFAMALLEAPLVGISSEAVALAPLLIASLAGLHLAAAVSGRRRQR